MMKQGWDHAGELHAVVLECEKDELLCENDELCIKNEELCIKNEEFCIQMMDFADPSQRGSSVVRDHRQRLWLSTRRSQIVTLQLHGFVFFGNVVGIVQDIEQRIKLPLVAVAEVDDAGSMETGGGGAAAGMGQAGTPPRKVSPLRLDLPQELKSATPPSPLSSPSQSGRTDGFFEITPLKPQAVSRSEGTDPTNEALDLVTAHVIVDFSDVNGVDATAARSCFLQLAHILHVNGIGLVLTGMRPRVQSLLQAHGVITDDSFAPRVGQTAVEVEEPDAESAAKVEKEAPLCRVFDTLDLALEDCEDNILASCPPPTPLKTAGGVTVSGAVSRKLTLSGSAEPEPEPELKDIEQLTRILSGFVEGDEELSALRSTDMSRLGLYFERLELEPQTVIFKAQDPATDIFVIESGDVSLLATADGLEAQAVSALPTAAGAVIPTAASGETAEGGVVAGGDSAGGERAGEDGAFEKLVRIATPRTGTSIGDGAHNPTTTT